MILNSGFILRQMRELTGLRQWDLAARLGFSSAVLCDIEKGRKELTPEIREKAERIFEEEGMKNDKTEFSPNMIIGNKNQ